MKKPNARLFGEMGNWLAFHFSGLALTKYRHMRRTRGGELRQNV